MSADVELSELLRLATEYPELLRARPRCAKKAQYLKIPINTCVNMIAKLLSHLSVLSGEAGRDTANQE